MGTVSSGKKTHSRLVREFATMKAMVRIYCRDHHDHNELCSDCLAFLDYAGKRLDNCPFQQKKPTCGNCTIHCYKKDMRDLARKIMRYAGPRMITRHPVMALQHLIDSRRPVPVIQLQRKSER